MNTGLLSLTSATLVRNSYNQYDSYSSYLIVTGIVRPGSSVPTISQVIFTLILDGPSTPSLSRGDVRTSTALPLFVSIMIGMSSASSTTRDMSSPTLPNMKLIIQLFHFIFIPITPRCPTTDPTGRSSGTKKLSVDPPPVRKHLSSSPAMPDTTISSRASIVGD